MRNKSALIAGILAGLASPSSVYADHSYSRVSGSDLSRIRGDVRRVGEELNKVVESQHGNKFKKVGRA